MKLGVDVLFESRKSLLLHHRVGLVTNYSMTNSSLVPVIDCFREDTEFELVKLFGPEHGVKNSAKEGEHVDFEVDPHSGIRAYSLYGETRRPSAEMMEGIDVLVVDLQDIGARYYTNASTLFLCMESCNEAHVPCIVLDRPNPIGGSRREGFVRKPEFSSFVGMLPVVNRHGCTMGELAQLIKKRFVQDVELTVVSLEGWHRQMLYSDTGLPWVSPSPNTTGLSMMLLYPGTCLVEGTNLSIGRGTTHPFEYVGAPWLDGHRLAAWFNQTGVSGVVARPAYFTPFYSQYQGQLCQGVQLHVTHASKVHGLHAGITLIRGIKEMWPREFKFLDAPPQGGRPFFDLLAGDDALRSAISSGTADTYLDKEDAGLRRFSVEVSEFQLYE